MVAQISSRSLLSLFHRLYGLRGRGASASAALAAGSAAAPVSARRRSAAPPGPARPAARRLSGGRWLPASPPAAGAHCIEDIPSLPPIEAPVSRNDNLTTESRQHNTEHPTRVPRGSGAVAGVLDAAQAASPSTQTLVQQHTHTRVFLYWFTCSQQFTQMFCMRYKVKLRNKNKRNE